MLPDMLSLPIRQIHYDTGHQNSRDLPIQYRVSPKHKDIGYICEDNADFYKIEYKIKKFIDWKSFLKEDLTMETE